MEKQTALLKSLDSIVSEYMKMGAAGAALVFDDAEKLNVLLKDLSSVLFFLEEYRCQAAENHNEILYKYIYQEEKSVSGSEVIATKLVPELYRLRRIMTSGYKVQDAIRTNISFLKSERK